jgi:hypothetical protein
MIMRPVLSLALAVVLGASAVACEKVDHDNIEKWGGTEKGPGKLMETLKSSEHAADLRGHAALKLIELGRFSEIKEILEGMDEGPRHKIMADLSTRLWEAARINDAMDVPKGHQATAKDVLYYTMDFGDAATRAKMADYLVEWFVGGHYEGRAKAGSVSGSLAMRKVGEAAAGRLLNSARAIVAKPPDADGRREQVGDELLKGLALSGSTEALEFLMQLVAQPRDDVSLPKRAIGAMHFAYVEPTPDIEPVDGKALIKVAEKLEAMVFERGISATMRNDAVAMLSRMPPSNCIPVFTRMISYPTDQKTFLWMGTQKGMLCGGAQGIEAITEAIPATVSYQRGMLSKYLWDGILVLEDKKKIATAASALLQSKSWVSRVTGIELLGLLGKAGAAADNISKIRELSGDSHRLKNWWGDQKDVPKSERKSEPTIGEVASNVAKSLETLASGG